MTSIYQWLFDVQHDNPNSQISKSDIKQLIELSLILKNEEMFLYYTNLLQTREDLKEKSAQ